MGLLHLPLGDENRRLTLALEAPGQNAPQPAADGESESQRQGRGRRRNRSMSCSRRWIAGY
ncbi:hypothetical protein MJ575_21805 [Klebsiella pneumoniae]|nr:hypothetical protein MJ575_21805 [Klebsiella pneumoniae]